MRISDWSSDVCSSDLFHVSTVLIQSSGGGLVAPRRNADRSRNFVPWSLGRSACMESRSSASSVGTASMGSVTPSRCTVTRSPGPVRRSEEHTSELQSLMRISYAVFCLKKKKKIKYNNDYDNTTQINNTNNT